MSILTAQTRFGAVRGAALKGRYEGITTFRSVPYAAPPVGALRFRPPVDPHPWKGVLDATHEAPRPVQETAGTGISIEPWAKDFYADGVPPMSEDCLYLHVTTGAADPSERRPVYMWFHGGGLASGYYTEIEFDPSELARRGIVVVSVAQRLNVFGYLCLPQLSAEQGGLSGNYGLLDEIKALEWVRENISAFGGDPENVTVGGQSGGTSKSTALALSPKARGMIRRVVNESNLAWKREYPALEQAQERGLAYLENIGLRPDVSPDELRALPAMRFYELLKKPEGRGAPGGIPSGMVADGVNVAFPSGEKNMEAYGAGLDFLSGGNVGESSVRGFGLGPAEKFRSAAEFYAFMREKLGHLYDEYSFEENWPVTDGDADLMSRVLASRAFSGGLGGGVIQNRYFGALRAKTAPEARTWSYVFGRFPPCLPEEKGTYRDTDNLLAWHSSELWYAFASLREGVPACRPWEPADFDLAEQMCSYWANFIATGDPNGTDGLGRPLPAWPESRGNWGWMEFGNGGPVGREGLCPVDRAALAYLKEKAGWPEP